jgi:molybdopterin-guanine dinucleotide biosynthesis protein A
MPLLPDGVIRYMAALAGEHPESDIFVPADGGLYQPLCAVYRKSCLWRAEANLRQGNYKLQDIYKEASSAEGHLEVFSVPVQALTRFGNPEIFFGNANDPHSFEKLRRAGAARHIPFKFGGLSESMTGGFAAECGGDA